MFAYLVCFVNNSLKINKYKNKRKTAINYKIKTFQIYLKNIRTNYSQLSISEVLSLHLSVSPDSCSAVGGRHALISSPRCWLPDHHLTASSAMSRSGVPHTPPESRIDPSACQQPHSTNCAFFFENKADQYITVSEMKRIGQKTVTYLVPERLLAVQML